MARSTPPLSDAACRVLAAASIEHLRGTSYVVRMHSGQLARDLYVEVNEVFARFGGKWARKHGGHVFDHDPTEELTAVRVASRMPEKNPLDYFPTPPEIVAKLLRAADLLPPDSPTLAVLEPSAGDGAIADAVRAAMQPALDAQLSTLHVCELDPRRAARLVQAGHTLLADDFLALPADQADRYDRVVMNPPFTAPGDALAYITHVQHAWAMTAPGGVLVAVTPPSWQFREDRRSREFREFITTHGWYEELPEGAFKASGTEIRTTMVVLEKRRAA